MATAVRSARQLLPRERERVALVFLSSFTLAGDPSKLRVCVRVCGPSGETTTQLLTRYKLQVLAVRALGGRTNVKYCTSKKKMKYRKIEN